ncbi:MAG: hypothetical protein HQL21_03975 [Candidatus Omnitrophica bacterium]|nr:hypothetical protein [Candidatus Omnitrophota bacterium]
MDDHLSSYQKSRVISPCTFLISNDPPFIIQSFGSYPGTVGVGTILVWWVLVNFLYALAHIVDPEIRN